MSVEELALELMHGAMGPECRGPHEAWRLDGPLFPGNHRYRIFAVGPEGRDLRVVADYMEQADAETIMEEHARGLAA